MTDPKNHHLLPRFYLSGFCHKETHLKENHDSDKSRCRVWVHDKKQSKVRQRGVKNLSVERHYYSADVSEGGLDAAPEKVLANIEDRAARVIKRLSRDGELRPEKKSRLAIFTALMKFRTSSYRPWAQSFATKNEPALRTQAFPTIEVLQEGLRQAGYPQAEDRETLERVFRDIHDGVYELTLTKNYLLQRMYEQSHKVAQVLLKFDWMFAWAPHETSFATSDDPVLVLGSDFKAQDDFLGEVGFASPGATTIMPLNQEVLLLISAQLRHKGHHRVSREVVRYFNREQTRHYERWLIARDEALVEHLVS